MSFTIDEINALRSTFLGFYEQQCGIQRPVYLGLRHLQGGELLYRGCTAQSKLDAKTQLNEARFFSFTRSVSASYAKPKAGDPPGAKSFLLFLTIKEPVILANVSLYPLVQTANPRGCPHEWQRLNSTVITSRLIDNAIDGIWDHEGEEILIEKPMEKLRLRKIVEINIQAEEPPSISG